MDKSKNIDLQDERLQAVAKLAEDWKSPWTGQVHEKGTIINLVAVCNYEKIEVTVPMPSAPAMFLNVGKEMYKKSVTLRDELFANVDCTKKGHLSFNGWDRRVIDYYELISGAYIFSITAIESYVNEKIPDDYTYTKNRGDKKCTESYNKDQIERFISLDEKISDILPIILKVKSPKGKKIYQNYLAAREVRDRIIHMKSKDRKSGEKKTIWNDLLNKNHVNPVMSATELIKYFFQDNQLPKWL